MEEPKFEVIEFDADDVIVTSNPSGEQCEGPDAPMNNCGANFMVDKPVVPTE